MKLTDEDAREFQRIWKTGFNEEISEAYARTRAAQLIELFTVIAKPLP